MKAWLFDLDGTLLDTAPDLHRALSALLSEQGREPIPLEVMRRYVSRGARGLVRLAFGELDDDTELTTRLVEIYAQDIASETRLFDELDVLLASLRSGGLRWGIVTNKLEALARQVLESMPQAELLHDCALLIGGDTAGERKPHPAPLLLAADQLGLPVSDIVYVGDAPTDIEAGRRAGMTTVSVGWGYVPDDVAPPVDWQADHHAERPDDLIELLRTL